MFKPASDILPSLIELVLLRLSNNFSWASNVLLLNYSLFLHMFPLYLHLILLSHRNHLKGLYILSLTPFRESSSAVPFPVHISQLCETWILWSSHLLVPRKLANILEATLPDWLTHDAWDAPSEVRLTPCVFTPRSEEISESTLEIHILVIFRHQRHHFAPLYYCLFKFCVCGLGRLNQSHFLAFELGIFPFLYKGHIVHLVVQLGDGRFRVPYLGHSLPI